MSLLERDSRIYVAGHNGLVGAAIVRRPGARRQLIGVAMGAAGLWASFRAVNWEGVVIAFQAANTAWVGGGIVTILATLVLVTVRWRLLLGNETVRPPWRALWDAVVLGQAVNIALPLRFGEGARLVLSCQGTDLPVGHVAVALAVERAFDVAAFAAAALIMGAAGLVPDAFVRLMPAVATMTAFTVVAVVVFVRVLPGGLRWARTAALKGPPYEDNATTGPIAALTASAEGSGESAEALRRRKGPRCEGNSTITVKIALAQWLERHESAMRDGWTELRRGPRLTITALLTTLITAGAVSTNLMIMAAFHLDVPLVIAAVLLLLVLQAGTAVVSVPGNVGVFHYLTIATLAMWHVPRPTALAVAIVLHIVSLGPKVVLGCLVLATNPSFAHSLRSQPAKS